MVEMVSRRPVRVVRTDLRSSSREVWGASVAAAAGAAATGAATGTAGAAATGAAAAGVAFLAAALAGAAAGAAATGAAGAGAAAGATSSVFLATRLAFEAEEAAAEFIIPVPVEVFISNIRTMLDAKVGLRIKFYRQAFNLGIRAHTGSFFLVNGIRGMTAVGAAFKCV